MTVPPYSMRSIRTQNGEVVSTEDLPEIPADYGLHNNFPNPFNPITQITFTLPMTDNVTVTIYNALGQEIQLLVSERLRSGVHTIPFDGSGLPSGIYYYNLKAGSFSQTKAMTLIK
jgi:hypothetical protein